MRYIFGLYFIFTTLSLFSQSIDNTTLPSDDYSNPLPAIDPRLYEAFDSTYLITIQKTNTTLLRRWNFYLDHAFVISEFPTEKGEIGQFPEIEVPDPDNVNIFRLEKQYKLHRNWETMTFYRLRGTNKVLAYFSGKEFMRQFSKSLK